MLIIGHRGAKGLASENTIASFEAAIKNKVDAVEFDIRVTIDNIPVITHNEYLLKSGRKLHINKSTYSELMAVKPDLLTLDETLNFLKNKISLVIEIKPKVNCSAIIKCLKNHFKNNLDADNCRIASFDPGVLSQIKASFPRLTLVVNEKWSGVRAGHRARKLNTKFITMNHKWLWSGFIRAVTNNGYNLSTYTLNDPKRAAKWATSGLYGVITDYPDRFI